MIKKLLVIFLVATLATSFVSCKSTQESVEELKIPSLTSDELELLFAEDTIFHTNESGAIIEIKSDTLESQSVTGSTPATIWHGSDGSTSNFTLPETLTLANGSLGTLQIPRIGLSVSVYETDDAVESMKHGAAHLKETSAWDGNIGLAAHNRGINTFFGKIHTLKNGDEIHFATNQGQRTYAVESTATIDQMDWSLLGRTEDNRITLVTCIDGRPSQRLVVQAVEVSSTTTTSVE